MTSSLEYTWFKLFKTEGVGPKTINNIYQTLKNNSEINENKIVEYLSKKNKLLTNWNNINDELCFLEYQKIINQNINIINLDSKDYPLNLKINLKNSAPPLLFFKGNKKLLNAKNISIVGSRNVFEGGINFTKKITKELTLSGLNIVSGYAKGVDTISHLSALENDGTTIFVLSYGINDFKRKKEFSDLKLNDNSLILSQFLPETNWSASNAMIRNKTIVGLSNAVIIIQAGPERDEKGNMSGSFNSGKVALENNIPLFVLKPSIVENARGNLDLIKKGGIEVSPENAIEKIKEILNSKKSIKNKEEQSAFDFI